MHYDYRKIEKKWQIYWAKNQTFKAEFPSKKPKCYVLDMFPYPSGAGLHVGHPLGYIASDIYARYKRHQGYNVLHPMGYDSFGLPAEQYAIQTGQHPALTTKKNIDQYRQQLEKLGFSFDWSTEVRTSDPLYYKWTQWIFSNLFDSWYDIESDCAKSIDSLIEIFKKKGNVYLKAVCDKNLLIFNAKEWNNFSENEKLHILLKYRLAFLSDTEVNWCEELGTVLANDEVINGVSERGGYPVVRKKMKQWFLRITAYAERLLKGLDTLDWSESLKKGQRHWIGKSLGTQVKFDIEDSPEQIEIFTTRVDTIFGVTFITLAPESKLVRLLTKKKQKSTVDTYLKEVAKRTEVERLSDNKRVSGVFTGAYAIHPLNKERLPIWVGDYVLHNYGSGAIMGVPCGDQRDYDFAKHFGLSIKNIFENVDISDKAFTDKQDVRLVKSDIFDALNQREATKQIINLLEQKNRGKAKVNYRLRDAIFSRQRYWGEPFPIYYKDGIPRLIDQKHLPIVLPKVENYLPTKTGKPPLGNASEWAWDTKACKVVDNHLINDKDIHPMDFNTMPGWAGSSWYFNRYMDAQNSHEFVSKKAVAYWKNVDLYIGGNEHATGHLLYSRFWQNFLYDKGFLPVREYAKKLINQGMILGESAIIYRDKKHDIYYSKNQIKRDYEILPIHIDIKFVTASNILDIENFQKSAPHYKNSKFICESDGLFIVKREVEKMSKSKYNVVNPDEICQEYGADTLRMYEMFLGPIEQSKPWNMAGINGVSIFLKKFWKLFFDKSGWCVNHNPPSLESLKILHKTIKKITEDIERFSFNTSVSAFMICVNELHAQKCHSEDVLVPLVILIAPFSPHMAEELWERLGHNKSITTVKYPRYDSAYLVEHHKEYPVSFNGKVKFKTVYGINDSVADIQKDIMTHPETLKYAKTKDIKKVIVVPNKIINIVVL